MSYIIDMARHDIRRQLYRDYWLKLLCAFGVGVALGAVL